jgi:hypothetical protein
MPDNPSPVLRPVAEVAMTDIKKLIERLPKSFADWECSAFGYGYGTGEQHTLKALKDFMGAIGRDDAPHAYDHEQLEAACTPAVAWLLISALCRANMIEYGTSPRFGWLTNTGCALKQFVDGKTVDELVALTVRTEDFDVCYPDACNCGLNGYEAGKVCVNPFWQEAAARAMIEHKE